jgi:hypothetical protein
VTKCHLRKLIVYLGASFVIAGSLGAVVVLATELEKLKGGSQPLSSVGETADPLNNKPKERLREGARITETLGEFRDTGERIEFHPRDMNVSFQTLENLALERIARVLESNPKRLWSVSGDVTEYNRSNYLLVTRAILKAKDPKERRTPGVPKKKQS